MLEELFFELGKSCYGWFGCSFSWYLLVARLFLCASFLYFCYTLVTYIHKRFKKMSVKKRGLLVSLLLMLVAFVLNIITSYLVQATI